MLEPKPNTSLFYIYYYPNGEYLDGSAPKVNIYIICKIVKENKKLTNKRDKKNCEFTIKQVIPEVDAVLPSEVEKQEKLLKKENK